ncbi:MAG: hypothetical protein JOY55_08050 [Mycobacterium sp.]|nr:hypothetical protein [Mycobacterium sp.]
MASFAAVSCSAEGAESMAGYIADADVVGLAADPGTAASSSMPTSG